MNSELYKTRLREAKKSGCGGLLNGIAYNIYSGKECRAASSSKKDGPFYCKTCYSDVIIKKCTDKIDHFAHTARLSPTGSGGESDIHKICKTQLCEQLSKIFPKGNWDTERPIPAGHNIDKLIPDVSGRVNDERLVIEVQASTLTIEKIIKRFHNYNLRKIPMLWVIPLTEPLGVADFRPRLFEKYLHLAYGGRVYYWWEGLNLIVKPVHFGTADRWIEESSWHDEYGEEKSAGGYSKPYILIKSPQYGPDSNIASDFINKWKRTYKFKKALIPDRSLWVDKNNNWWSTNDLAENNRLYESIASICTEIVFT